MPLREARGLVEHLPRLEAQHDLRALSLITFPNWSGESSNAKQAAREGTRKRKKFLQVLQRQARGLGEFDEVDGQDILRSGDDVISWLGFHGIDNADAENNAVA